MASVQSQNLFALLQDDVTEVNTVKAPPPKAAPVAAAPAPKKEAPKAAAPAKKEEARPERSGDAARGGRGGARGGRGGAGPRREGDRPPRGDGERRERPPRAEGDMAPRHRREGGDDRPPREGRARPPHERTKEYTTKGEREHDRRSRGPPGSADKNDEKRGGRGAHNWGDPVVSEETPAEGAEVPDVSAPREPTEEELAAQKEREEEEKQMTLEEYRKLQAEKVKKVEVQRRAANEGSADPNWSNTVVVRKDDEVDPFLAGMKKEKAGKKKNSKAADAPQPELFEFKFNDEGRQNDRRRPERGGFGGDRRGGDRGARRGNAPRAGGPAPAINDESAFPSLG